MFRALKQYWTLGIIVALTIIIAVGAYLFQFHDKGISEDPANWADFATYISGTVGVIIVGATLVSLFNTMSQQRELIKQQDNIIKQQGVQISITDSHQRKMAAYSVADQIFPTLLDACLDDMGVSIYQRFVLKEYSYLEMKDLPPEVTFGDLFDFISSPYIIEHFGNLFFAALWSEFLVKPFELAKLIAQCLEDAPELEPYFRIKIGGYYKVINCSLEFIQALHPQEVRRIKKSLVAPEDLGNVISDYSIWREIGVRNFSRRE